MAALRGFLPARGDFSTYIEGGGDSARNLFAMVICCRSKRIFGFGSNKRKREEDNRPARFLSLSQWLESIEQLVECPF